MNIGETLAHNARNRPHAEALVFGRRRLTWRQLDAGANRVANVFLALGVEPGDRVAYVLDNGIEFVETFFGLAKIGCIGAPVVPGSAAREITHMANDLGAKFLICQASNAPAVEAAAKNLKTVDDVIGVGEGHPFGLDYARLRATASAGDPGIAVGPDADLAIKYTSGTTGAPKGCLRTHRQLIMVSAINLVHIPAGEGDRATISGPLAAGSALSMLSLYVLAGATIVLLPKFDETELLEIIEREAITIAYANGAVFRRFAFHPDLARFDLSSLRVFSGSSSSPTADMAQGLRNLRAQGSFQGGFFSAFASTEAGGRVTYLSPEDCARGLARPQEEGILQSIGREALLCRVESLDQNMTPLPAGEVGQMAIKSPTVFKGYWNRPEETAKSLRAGWLLTGDLMRKDEAGYCFMAGRLREMIRTGGMNVYPAEIEPLLISYPKIANAALVGLPDEKWGEKVIACVIAEEGCTEAEIVEFCRANLAPHKRPKKIVFLSEFPLNANAKVLKRELREMLARRPELIGEV